MVQLIHDIGSISKAAAFMGISYKKAWTMVDELNSKEPTAYVIALYYVALTFTP